MERIWALVRALVQSIEPGYTATFSAEKSANVSADVGRFLKYVCLTCSKVMMAVFRDSFS